QSSAGTQYLHDAVLYAYGMDVPMLAASGNNAVSGGVAFPGRWPETITVAATDNQDERASFSNTGSELDVAAPGEDIYSLFGLTGFSYRDGTSMATPHVSGLVCLMLSLVPELETELIRTILHETSVDVELPGFDIQTGWGRIDAQAALIRTQEEIELIGDVNEDGMVNVDDLLELLAAWGPCPDELPCPADLDGSGSVGVDDLLMLIVNWS
ncbi:MAG: S8 family serine peptidase, partial [Planctomycetota bacterium]